MWLTGNSMAHNLPVFEAYPYETILLKLIQCHAPNYLSVIFYATLHPAA
jgi:hypothetical protein